MLVDGEPMSGSLFDFGLYLFHNAKELLERGSGPYFYLPKMESHLEARLWNDVFLHAQDALGIPRGTIKATVLIETILAAFEMDEILYELRDHSAGLNCGRWDYIFSFIKKFATRPDCVLPDRAPGDDGPHFLRAYVAAADQDLPSPRRPRDGRHGRADPDQGRPGRQRGGARQGRADKEREASDGHDGTWVAHPGLVPIAKEVSTSNAGAEPDRRASARTSASPPRTCCGARRAAITEAGLRQNIRVGIRTSRPGCAASAACRSTT